jgi:hypothetical protein
MAVPVTDPGILWQIFTFFGKAGAFVFGSGLAIVPFLYGGLVNELQWLNSEQFVDACSGGDDYTRANCDYGWVYWVFGSGASRSNCGDPGDVSTLLSIYDYSSTVL